MKVTSQIQLDPTLTYSTQQLLELLCKARNIADLTSFLEVQSPVELSLKDFGYDTAFLTLKELLQEAYEKEKTVVVYTDYDADGITGGSLLWETLHLLGFKVFPYVPKRLTEGYGFSTKGIDAIKGQYDPFLIISVDHGIAAVEQVAYARNLGINIVITDHHARQEKLPETANAIIHIPALSGSAVAYFVAKEIFSTFGSPDHQQYQTLSDHFSCDYLALAAIGTIADLVPLTGPSRSIAKYGLDAFRSLSRVGLKELLHEAQISDTPVSTYHIGYIIAPRINAIGRLEHALDAVRLLCTKSRKKAQELAQRMGSLNNDRRSMVEKAVQQAVKQVEEIVEEGELPKVLVLVSDEWHEGIIGLIAGEICEKYYRPAIVLTKGENYYKGSVRSISGTHITEFLSNFKELLLNYGGHAQAAGLSIEKENIPQFIEKVTLKSAEIPDEAFIRILKTDLTLPLPYATLDLAHALAQLEPFGMGNPRPVFQTSGILKTKRLIGSKKNHLTIVLGDPEQACELSCIAFNKGADYERLTQGQKYNIVVSLDVNEWKGKRSVQGKLMHWYQQD